ncbi:sec-independent translocase [Arthrobacter sp. I2-34]|uniref:Sec-independent translocase n=1 Tax=Arthrobacter hankyongi TaxID=2904801 RepID=A0ABS9LD32_9MICC|nr:sec-independent translocase [Arthrobacter hankyongi]MCG2624486.1 sec-independent translocase [Arthrobacter hankyongi]
MFGINGSELIILAVIAVIVLGPERLPEYAAQLARLVKQLRNMAAGAKEQLREEVGDEIVDMDWRKLDPRQYDPRRIIREALMDDDEAPVRMAAAAGTAAVAAQARPAARPVEQLEPGVPAPFDPEAT